MSDCRLDENLKINGVPGFSLENQQLRVVVLTGKGTDILEFRHKPSGIDVLFKTPWGLKNPQTYVHDTPAAAAPFMDFYPGGWQELFPNAGNNCVYRGAELGFHGEICKVPWEFTVLENGPQQVAVKYWVRTVRCPFLVEKTLRLRSDRAALEIQETITNEGAEPMDFMWGHHPAFGAPFLDEHCRLFAPATGVETAHPLPAHQRLPPETRFERFPHVRTSAGDDFDVSRMWPPTARFAHLSYLTGLKDGWYCLVNEKTRLGFALRWDLSVFRYLWLWQEFCGTPHYPWWGQGYVTGIEPHSSIPGLGLEKAIDRGTQLTLAPRRSLSTQLCASLFQAEDEPKGVTEDGKVLY
ncbi:MAG: aldose 1-epimerase [Acidobacteria bacterium]|nr:aldose 1-epimerase [Acidobacteriota bacterium]MCI0717551.1 aldose 1-epimerase [Acidobacteriota bacterium]